MNSEEKKIEYSNLLKYFEDRASREEADLVISWLQDSEGGFTREKILRLLWNDLDSGDSHTDTDLEGLFDEIQQSILLKQVTQIESGNFLPGSNGTLSFNRILRYIGQVAAIFLAPVMGYIAWEIYNQKMWVNNQAEVVYNEIKCPLGARSQAELPDGTKVFLNNGSTLRYPAKFTGDTREVELFGEAFFDVEHNRQRPFIINTTGLDVKVLGTRLNVYSYPEENYQEITLESGSVELIDQEDNREITVAKMQPGEHVVYRFGDKESDAVPEIIDRDQIITEEKEKMESIVSEQNADQQALPRLDEGEIFLKMAEPERYTGWTDGKLIMRNDPMPVLLKRMERWYNVKFNILDKRINEYTYWVTFQDENIDQVISLLSLTGPIKFTKRPRKMMPDGTYLALEIDVTIRG